MLLGQVPVRELQLGALVRGDRGEMYEIVGLDDWGALILYQGRNCGSARAIGFQQRTNQNFIVYGFEYFGKISPISFKLGKVPKDQLEVGHWVRTVPGGEFLRIVSFQENGDIVLANHNNSQEFAHDSRGIKDPYSDIYHYEYYGRI